MKTEMELTDEELGEVRLGRNPFLRKLGAVLFGGVAAVALKSAPAEADYIWACGSDTIPRCDHCERRLCPTCRAPITITCNLGNGQCWNICDRGTIIRCCDWVQYGSRWCICWETWGTRQCDNIIP